MTRLHPLLLLLASACTGNEFDTGDTGDDTGDTDTADTDSDDTDTDSDDTDTDSGDTADTSDTGTPPDLANWDFEDWAASDPPDGFTKYPTADWTVATSTDRVEGDAAAALTLTATATTRLLLADAGVALPTASTYRFHAWLKDDDPDVAARLVVQSYYGTTLVTTVQEDAPTTDDADWVEHTLDVTVTTQDSLRPRLRVEEVTGSVAGSSIGTDAWAITRPYTFAPLDGDEDAPAENIAGVRGTGMDVSAATNSDGMLYLSTNRTDFDSDNIVFVWVGPPSESVLIAPPWDKGGTVAGPSPGSYVVALVQEQSNQFCEWLIWGGTNWAVPSNSSCDSEDHDAARLEGVIPLADVLGIEPHEVPRLMYVAVAPWETNTGATGELRHEFQVPQGNGDLLLDADEVIEFSRAGLLAGRLVPEP